MPAERPLSKASENRRATKPIMEKRRRARINQCLSELKTLILDALNKDPSRHSKLEKADILEMTVHHLQNIQRQQMAAAISTDSSVLNKFRAGFSECATEVSRYVGRIEGVDPALRQRLLSHLSHCLASINSSQQQQQPFQQQQSSGGGNSLSFGNSFPGLLQSLSVQIPATRSSSSSSSSTSGDLNNNHTKLFAGLSVIPSRLPNGDFAFLLPSHALSSASFHLPPSASSSSLGGPEDRSHSQSSWPPSSPPCKRSPSPDESMSEEVLSPTCSDAGSDVFLEPSQTHKRVSSPPHLHTSSPPPLMKDRRHGVSFHHPMAEPESVWRPW